MYPSFLFLYLLNRIDLNDLLNEFKYSQLCAKFQNKEHGQVYVKLVYIYF